MSVADHAPEGAIRKGVEQRLDFRDPELACDGGVSGPVTLQLQPSAEEVAVNDGTRELDSCGAVRARFTGDADLFVGKY